MAETLRIFVSATADLEPERAVIGRTLAELPVQIRAEIQRSPARGIPYEDLFEMVARCDRFYFLLGQDITAPAGAEWQLAWRLERSVLPLRKLGPLTLAAREFLHLAPVPWIPFRNHAELAQLIELDLIDLLLHPTNRYGLTTQEMELLALRRQHLQEKQVKSVKEPGGAGGGGVLLDQGRQEPLAGVPLDETSGL
jgi:hypothetical protein